MSGTSRERALQRVPKPRREVDLRSLPLTPTEAFVLSRLDGATSAELVADVTGLAQQDALAALARLEQLGAIEWLGAELESFAATLPGAGGDCELTEEERQRIAEAEQVGRGGTHWEVLGLTGEPSAAAVKRAYFAASKTFHPDRFFGRKLGSYGPRIEAVFRRIKEAYDVLSDETARRAYALAHPPAKAVEPPAPPPPSVPAPPSAASEAERQQRLEERRRQILEERRRKRTQAPHGAHAAALQQAREHYEDGMAALRKGDTVAAAASLKLAMAFDADNEEYKSRHDAIVVEANGIRAKRLFEAAEVEAAAGNGAMAGNGFAQASDLVPTNVRYAMRAAEELLAGREPVRAWTYAERAVASGGQRKEARMIAGAVLEARGDKAGALAQYEVARALDGRDPHVKKAIARLSKSE